MHEKIIILDFGSATTQLIGRKVREMNTYCEVVPFNKFPLDDESVKGVILSGSPLSVNDSNAFSADLSTIRGKYPVLAIGYGAQLLAKQEGALVLDSDEIQNVEEVEITSLSDNLLDNLPNKMRFKSDKSDFDSLPSTFKPVAKFGDGRVAAYKIDDEQTWGIQFYPELSQTSDVLDNFLTICNCNRDWTSASFVENAVKSLKQELGNDKVILALSGGVDSSVVAVLLNKTIGRNLTCIFVDHGLLRKNEFEKVQEDYEHLGLNVIGVNAREHFYSALKGVSDPEEKRKIIGKGFIDVFDSEAQKLDGIKWLAQGTIYPDIIESLSVTGVTIKSHHNVGGLPDKMKLKLCEPLKMLFKDEVRSIGLELGMKPHLINRHPFPGPGLGIRILGEITPNKVRITQDADDIFISALREYDLYDKVWQAGAILLPVQSVGKMNEERTYENTIALRAVISVDAMTADWAQLPYDFLAKVSNDIIKNVKGVNRVVYDISSKPPATIEWE